MNRILLTRVAMGLMLASLAAAVGVSLAQEKGGEAETGPYEVAEGWPQPLGHTGWTWGSQGGVFAETPNRIYILQRGELPIPEKAPEGYTGGYGSFGQPATQGKPRMENSVTASTTPAPCLMPTASFSRTGPSGIICLSAGAAPITSKSALTIRKSTSGLWTICSTRSLSSHTTASNSC